MKDRKLLTQINKDLFPYDLVFMWLPGILATTLVQDGKGIIDWKGGIVFASVLAEGYFIYKIGYLSAKDSESK